MKDYKYSPTTPFSSCKLTNLFWCDEQLCFSKKNIFEGGHFDVGFFEGGGRRRLCTGEGHLALIVMINGNLMITVVSIKETEEGMVANRSNISLMKGGGK